MTTSDDLEAELDEAIAMPNGDGKMARLEHIIEHADALGDVRLGFDARFEFIRACQYHTEQWRMLPAFAWCLAAFDRDRGRFDEDDAEMLRWYHKWAIATLRSTPRVGLPQTVAALDDMERRYREGGHSMQAVYNARARTAEHVGDELEARRYLELWRTAERDENSDCAGCDPCRQAGLYANWGEWQRAVQILEPVVSGALGCQEQPERGLASALVPYIRVGRYDEAARAHVRAYRRHRYERDGFPYLADHLQFCALTGHVERGLDILAEHLGWLDRPFDDMSAMEFSAAGALLCRLAVEAGISRTIARPEHGERQAAELTVGRLAEDLAAHARDLAVRFDARNGTDHQSGRVEAWLAATPVTDGVELPPDPPRRGAPPVIPLGPGGREDLVAPLSVEAIAAILDERGDRYRVEGGRVSGQWVNSVIHFERGGERDEILIGRIIADRSLPADRRSEAYEFCNAWNHDKIMPKVYVHDTGDGELLVVGEVVTDLEYGVAGQQLAVLIDVTIGSGVQMADAVAQLP
jgi:hypothetical protein